MKELLIFFLFLTSIYFFSCMESKKTPCQKEIYEWIEKTKPSSYKLYEFNACGKTFYYYKSEGFSVWEKIDTVKVRAKK